MSSASVVVLMKVAPLAIAPMAVVVVPAVSVPLITAAMVVIVLVGVALTTLTRPLRLPGVTVSSAPELLQALLEGSIELLQLLLHLNLPHVVHHRLSLQTVRGTEGPLDVLWRRVGRRAHLLWGSSTAVTWCIRWTGVLRVCWTFAFLINMTAAGSELYVELPSIQTDSVEQVQGVGHGHFMFEVHECKLF